MALQIGRPGVRIPLRSPQHGRHSWVDCGQRRSEPLITSKRATVHPKLVDKFSHERGVPSRSLRSWAASIQDREVWPCEVERAVEQKSTREAGATTGTARNEKVERGSLEAGGDIERSLDGMNSREPCNANRVLTARVMPEPSDEPQPRDIATLSLTSVSRCRVGSERRGGWETGRTPLAGRTSCAGL